MFFIVVLYDASHGLKMFILFTFQALLLSYAIFVRSFENSKDYAIEIINESTYLLLMLFL